MPEPVENMGTEKDGMAAIGLNEDGSPVAEPGAAAAGEGTLPGGEAGEPGAAASGAKEVDEADGAKPAGENGEPAENAGAEDTVESLREQLAVSNKRQRDGDGYISKLTNDIARHKASAINPKGKEADQLSAADEIEQRFPAEVAEIKNLRDNGKNTAAAIMENNLVSQVSSDRNAIEGEVRSEILDQTAEVLKLQDFPKYREQMSAVLNNIPIEKFQDRPGEWTLLAYQAAVGKSYMAAISKNVPKTPPGPISSSIAKGGAVSGKGNQPKSEADEVVDGMLNAGSSGTVFD